MSEVKTKPIALKDGEVYTASMDGGDVVFTDDMTIADIIRYAVSQSDLEVVKTVIEFWDDFNDDRR